MTSFRERRDVIKLSRSMASLWVQAFPPRTTRRALCSFLKKKSRGSEYAYNMKKVVLYLFIRILHNAYIFYKKKILQMNR